MLNYEFMRLALAAAVLVGLTAPTVGVYLVQRRLSLIGDGLGHVALLGVAVGLVTRSAPVLTALLATVAGAVAVEVLRARRSASADVALAIMFYGGLAGGVVVVTRAPAGTPITLDGYLFGALTTTTRGDLVLFAVLAAVVLAVTIGLGRSLFTVALDEEHARASGLPVLQLNLLLAVVTAVTVTLSMRVLGLLLISGLMVLPAGCAQLVARSFRSSLVIAALIGVTVSVSGTAVSWYADTPSGGTIVLMAVAAYAVLSVGRLARRGSPRHGPGVTPSPVRPVGRPSEVSLPR
ncbi:metal ABC transporter permease [Modestobacter sp. VKM Ac-2979]|uniref:metal ABC transporter permease n=1 Tax=unclassified Modestobacter TaxID=2643866 RepID=UPI0022AB6563|nr:MULTISPECIES: iron chelate uptake ABC transporter family permease subunit [unclassified Modestobacter]MCZ2814119.1 metal ABC transporter permease [Modestobacter sp. VKM Ac-2979]MCZ2844465.1 metal ABC transporter permease [Modestobacter sp. VKM Ac-2980]